MKNIIDYKIKKYQQKLLYYNSLRSGGVIKKNFFVSENKIKIKDFTNMMDQDVLTKFEIKILPLEELQASRKKLVINKASQAFNLLQRTEDIGYVMIEDTTIAYSDNYITQDDEEAYPGANTKTHIKKFKGKLEQVIKLAFDNPTRVWYTSSIAVAFNNNPDDVIYVENTVCGHFVPFEENRTGLIDSQFVPDFLYDTQHHCSNNNVIALMSPNERKQWHPRGGSFDKICQILKSRIL